MFSRAEPVTAIAGDHAGLMDDVYRGQRHIYDLTRKYYLLGRDRLIGELDVPDGGTVLEVGCGTGRNLARIARRWPTARLYGLDISDEMLKSALANLRAAKFASRTELARADAAQFDALQLFGRARFDRIMFSYTLSMIPDWQGALRQAAALLSTQGSIHIVDFGMQERLPGVFRHALLAWLRKFHVEPRVFLQEFALQLGEEIKRPVTISAPFRGYAQIIVIG
jgi:S-adenosylmethionine-diacylgycerolhomoserine-N-methlytransferase